MSFYNYQEKETEMRRTIQATTEEPEQKKFEIPGEGEHQFQVVDKWGLDKDEDIIIVKLEVSEGEELGRSILHRVNLDSEWKGFFLTRLFLKAIEEPYKGKFEVDDDNWIGKCFYATIIHNQGNNGKTYANIDEFNFEKKLSEQHQNPKPKEFPTMTEEERQKAIDNDDIAWDS